MREVIVLGGQSVVDVAIQEYGCINGVLWICQDNRIRPDVHLDAGDVLLIRDESDMTQADIDLCNSTASALIREEKLATSDVDDYDGIGFWILEDDFIVS